MPAPSPTVVLVHGAGAGAWTWEAVASELDARAVGHLAVDLPSVGEDADPASDVHTDASFVRGVVDGLEGLVVLCGNSYGGAVITEASAGHPRVARLVYVAAFMPDHDDELASFMADSCAPEFLAAVTGRDDGLVEFDPAMVAARAFAQSPPDVAERAAGRTRPMALGLSTPPTVTGVGWRGIPSTYVVCGADLLLSPEAQRRWARTRATDSVEFPFDHCPQVSHPVEIAEVLATAAAAPVVAPAVTR